MQDSAAPASYADATDEQVIANYAAACEAEVAHHDRGESIPAIVAGAADAWMAEGMRRGLL